MKKLYLIIAALFILAALLALTSCEKSECQTCTATYNYSANNQARTDTVYKDKGFCDDALDQQKAMNGKTPPGTTGGLMKVSCR